MNALLWIGRCYNVQSDYPTEQKMSLITDRPAITFGLKASRNRIPLVLCLFTQSWSKRPLEAIVAQRIVKECASLRG